MFDWGLLTLLTVGWYIQPIRNLDFSIGYQGETGVEAKGLVCASITSRINNRLNIEGVVGFGVLPPQGINHGAVSAEFSYPGFWPLSLKIGFQHQRWPNWSAIENRLWGLGQTQVSSRWNLGLGICRRLPKPGMNEWNLIYLLSWHLLSTPEFRLTAELTNYDRLELINPQQMPVGLGAIYHLTPEWQLFGKTRLAINGLSTGLIYPSAIWIHMGIKYGS